MLSLKDLARQAAREAERVALEAVLERERGNRARVARRLRISYAGLLDKLAQCGLATAPARRG